MQSITSPRFGLPLLASGQSRKELFHNEALTRIDFLIQPVAQSILNDPQDLSPLNGQAWLVGPSPTGQWKSKKNNIAGWSSGGWRFIAPSQYMRIFVVDQLETQVYFGARWHSNDKIQTPDGGSTRDAEARASIDSILLALRKLGILAS